MSKKIWIINQYSGSPYYGMNYRSYYLANELVKKGNSVTVYTGSYSHQYINHPKITGMFTKEDVDGINYIWIKTPTYRKSKSIGRIYNMLVFMIKLFFFNIFKVEKPDIIIVSSLSLFPVINAYIWSKVLKVEFIFEVRDIWPLTLIEVGGVSQYNPLVIILGWFEKLGYKKAKNVVSVLPNAKSHMMSHGMKADKFRYIPNGINLDEVENYKEVSSEIKRLIPHNKFIVGYLGTLGIANALEYFIEAAVELKDNKNIHFIFIGSGGEQEKLEKICVQNQMENVTFIKPVLKVEVQSVLKLFDVCYIGWYKKKIYKYGISANKIFDYMYSAKPILHSISIENNLVEEAKCGLTVEAENSSAIANGILELFHMDQSKLEEMGLNGKEYVIKNHSYLSLVNKYLEIL